jgi:hypothetical protein
MNDALGCLGFVIGLGIVLLILTALGAPWWLIFFL